MKFYFISIFPNSFSSYLNESILKKAKGKNLVDFKIINPRDFCCDKHKKADDIPYGGGVGMVLKAEPVLKAVDSLKLDSKKTKIIILSPNGRQFTNKIAENLRKKYKNIVLISGRYEGIDERVKKALKAEEISVGPYILTGGELASLVIADSVSRRVPGVLGKEDSLEEKREIYAHPLFTRPEIFEFKQKKYKVPKVLLSGNHEKIKEWRVKNLKK